MAEEDNLAVEGRKILDAASKHQVDELRFLLKTGSANFQDPDTGYSPLHVAILALGPEEKGEYSNPVEGDISSGKFTGSTNGVPSATQQNEGASNGSHGPSTNESHVDDSRMDAAKKTVQLLLRNGAIWNDLDKHGETPGCIAYRLGLTQLYDLMVDAGFRAEILLTRLDEYEALGGGSDEGVDDDPDLVTTENDERGGDSLQDGKNNTTTANGVPGSEEERAEAETTSKGSAAAEKEAEPQPEGDVPEALSQKITAPATITTNEEYLHSSLSMTFSRILDEEKNGVMMSWEDEIMRRTAELLCSDDDDDGNTQNTLPESASPSRNNPQQQSQRSPRRDLRILNIGHGMGIIDGYFQTYEPKEHHIIEAHPSVLAKMEEEGWIPTPTPIATSTSTPSIPHATGTSNPPPPSNLPTSPSNSSVPSKQDPEPRKDDEPEPRKEDTPEPRKGVKKNIKVHAGKWQDILPKLVEENMTFDVVYFDTFAEDYAAFREFFREYVVALLDGERGRWSFFHGLGADRRVCYDVYTKVCYWLSFSAAWKLCLLKCHTIYMFFSIERDQLIRSLFSPSLFFTHPHPFPMPSFLFNMSPISHSTSTPQLMPENIGCRVRPARSRLRRRLD